VLYNCLSWYKFVNTHLYHSRQLYNIQLLLLLQQARELEVEQNNDHGGVLLGVKCAQEGDRIPPLERHRQSLKQEHHFSRVPGLNGKYPWPGVKNMS